MNQKAILARAREVLNIEIQGLRSLLDRLDENFCKAIKLLGECNGKVVVTGMGKSGLICRKIAATHGEHGYAFLFSPFKRCASR